MFLALVGLGSLFVVEMPPQGKVQAAVLLAAYIVLGPILLWGIGELILLFVDMANDLRATRRELTRLRRRRG